MNLQSFKHYSFSNKIQNEAQAVEALRTSLGAAVDRHLLSDAPIGVFLSGGLDSSILTMLAASRQKAQLNSLSIYFHDERFSEKYYQDVLLQQVSCKSRQHLLDQQEFYEHFPEILEAMDMPCCDGINTWFISRYAKQEGLKAVLSGIGSDELLGGYPSFNRMAIANRLQQVPSLLINSGRKSRMKQLSRLSYLNIEGIKGAYLFLRGYFTPHEIARQLDTTEAEVWNVLNDTPVLQDISNLHPKDQASWMELNLYMQNQLLRDADVMGMANSVEIRVPFLDEDYIRLCLSVSPDIKYQGGGSKPLLVKAFKAQLPKQTWDRPKMGFSFPFTEWLNKSAYVKDMMENAGTVTQMYHDRFMKGGLHWSQLMLLILLENETYA